MITINYFKPFYTKVSGTKLRLVLAYQYMSIIKDNEVFHFIPIEEKEIVIDLKTGSAENLSNIFVFQRGNRFVRLSLYQLLFTSNIHDHLRPILDEYKEDYELFNDLKSNENGEYQIEDEEVLELINELEKRNIERYIDDALANGDKESFYKMTNKLNNLLTKS